MAVKEEVSGEIPWGCTVEDGLPLFKPEESDYRLRDRIKREQRVLPHSSVPSIGNGGKGVVLSSKSHHRSSADEIEFARYPKESRRLSRTIRGRL